VALYKFRDYDYDCEFMNYVVSRIIGLHIGTKMSISAMYASEIIDKAPFVTYS